MLTNWLLRHWHRQPATDSRSDPCGACTAVYADS